MKLIQLLALSSIMAYCPIFASAPAKPSKQKSMPMSQKQLDPSLQLSPIVESSKKTNEITMDFLKKNPDMTEDSFERLMQPLLGSKKLNEKQKQIIRTYELQPVLDAHKNFIQTIQVFQKEHPDAKIDDIRKAIGEADLDEGCTFHYEGGQTKKYVLPKK